MQQISSLLEILSYLDRIVLNKNSKIELKWWVKMPCINLTACRGVNNDRYLNKGMGSNVNRISTRGMSFAQEMKQAHKCRKTGYTNVLENLEAQSYPSPGGQHGSFNISVKHWGVPRT